MFQQNYHIEMGFSKSTKYQVLKKSHIPIVTKPNEVIANYQLTTHVFKNVIAVFTLGQLFTEGDFLGLGWSGKYGASGKR